MSDGRDREVAALVGAGLDKREIAIALGLSVYAVEVLVRRAGLPVARTDRECGPARVE